ncbi:putative thioesterase domain [Kingella potus]|uniref:Putative thioesterase domain n=1 Tax=Kingella potus TaxID=265175 RepID=A0A377R061_9NEIS|nr:YiiD C-terminal domain-containing protein [Kingella potus]UOP01465.1 thioesterase domain-containing protein [Kingella potus]STR00218.1 putative thioesterase domain [Kingella potus]
MTEQQLQDFLRSHIPATAALGIRVLACGTDEVRILMPHAPNRNHKNTVFGGSTVLGATVCGWALVHLNCPQAAGNIVIQSSQIRYTAPAHGDLTVSAQSPGSGDWARFHKMYAAHGKGKIDLAATAFSDGLPVAEFTARYAALAGAQTK